MTMSEAKKPVCLHFHIFKNAGSTVDWILDKNFSKNHLSMDNTENSGAILSWDKILDYFDKNPNVKAFSSHQIRFPVPNHTNFLFLPMVFIRQPIDRAFSIYSFKKRSTDDSIGTIKAQSMTVEEFIKWNLSMKNYNPMKNFQVLFLSDKDPKLEVNIDDFNLALERVKKCFIIGLVDRLDESLVLAEELLQDYFENIDLSYVKQNVSSDRKGDLNKRLEEGKSQISELLMEELINFNKLDLQLHSAVNEELNTRLKSVENFEEKLSSFRKRCEK